MNKVFIDTNVLLDWVVRTREDHATATALMTAIVSDGDEAVVLSSSLKDVYYLCCRHYAEEETSRDIVRMISAATLVADLLSDDVAAALRSDEPDLEDGIVRAVAERLRCDFFVTRDVKGFESGRFRKVSPAEALSAVYGK